MRCNRFSRVLTLAVVAMASLVLTTTAAGTVITGIANGPNGSHDTWNNAANWDAGIPSGAVDAVVGTGVIAQAWNTATPVYTGSLTLNSGSTLQMGWTTDYPESVNALGGSGITLNSGSEIRLRLPSPNPITLPAITMAGDASIHLSPSTSAHHRPRNFDGAITGSGALTVIGNNNNTVNLNLANPGWSGGFIANADDGWRVEANVSGAFGTGDVTFNARPANDRGATLQIDVADVIADTATLFLNGPRDQRKDSKLILNANDTVAGFWLDGVQMAPGDYTSSSGLIDVIGNPLITGSGILTVTPAGGPEPPGLKLDFNSNQNSGGDSSGGDPQSTTANHNQSGWESYHANHEVAAEFTTGTYPGGITVTPAWPNTTAASVQQSIDRGGQNAAGDVTGGTDNTWAPNGTLVGDAGDLNLVTDWLGIDTRGAGNGNWDGALAGTPTYMTLTLGGLSAGEYSWTSYHHDTENVHGFFQIEVSTDGGANYTNLGQDFYMTDGSDGGSPNSATDGAPFGPQKGLLLTPDPFLADNLPSTVNFNFAANGTDDVVLRFAPLSGTLGNAVHNQLWGINGFVLEPVQVIPEPSTFVLAALGLLGLAFFARRRRRLS